LAGLAASKGKAPLRHPAVILWSKRRTQKDLGIVINAKDLLDDEAELLEFCEATWSNMERLK